MSDPLLDASALYRGFRRGECSTSAAGMRVARVRFEARAELARGGEARWDENERFDLPLFLPAAGECEQLVIILNGLNDSSYRKFFPWGAALARAGVAALVLPSAFLLNRRPRAWITPHATELALVQRLALAPGSATAFNAVLSARIAQQPESLLADALRTGRDLRQLIAALRDGGSAALGWGRALPRGVRCHLLGYSLGGYLALALRLSDDAFRACRVIMLCAGACIGAAPGERLDPVSPFILDQHAAARWLEEVERMRASGPALDPLSATLLELATSASEHTRARIRALDDELAVLVAPCDRVTPALGVADNLGRIDAALACGSHEYPFNVADPTGPGAARAAAQAFRVDPRFAAAFRELIAVTLRTIGHEGETSQRRSSSSMPA